jgi:hypothetical protein
MGRLRSRNGQGGNSGKGHQRFSHGIHLSELNKIANHATLPDRGSTNQLNDQ